MAFFTISLKKPPILWYNLLNLQTESTQKYSKTPL